MREKFISLRITVMQDSYKRLQKEFGVRATPTVLFLAADGSEIDRIVGFNKDNKAEFVQKIRDFEAGENTLARVLDAAEKNPGDVQANWAMAVKYEDRYEHDKAQPYYKKVIELDPDDRSGHVTESRFRAATYEARYEKNPDPLKAFIASNPPEEFLERSYTTLASSYYMTDDLDSVAATYEEALRKLPDNPMIMTGYASCIFSGRMESLYEKGLELNERSKSLDPKLAVDYSLNLVTYYAAIDDNALLAETFEKAIEIHKDTEFFKPYYVSTIVRRGIEDKYDRAREILLGLVEENPEDAASFHNLALIYERQNDPEKAVEMIKKALEIDPERESYKKKLEELEKSINEE